MSFRSFYLLITLLFLTEYCSAQSKPAAPYDFLPREKVLFEDNFLTDTIGDFPAKWRIIKCIGTGKKDSAGIKFCSVQEDSLENVLIIPPYAETHLEQNINATHNVNDVFSLELDFYLGPQESNVTVDFQLAEKLSDCRSAFISVFQSGSIHYTTFYPKINELTFHYPGYMAVASWHHLAVSYFKGSMSCYIDQYKVFSLPATGYNPIKFGISAKGPARIKNFRLATGIEVNKFFKILTTKKMVLNDIYFDENKSNIKPISMRYIIQMAQFLKANPSVNLEIQVHSDNSGDPSILLGISKVRADEIKRQIVMNGVDAKRLTAKGMGDTEPLKTGDSPEDMAANRRVVFIIK